MRRLGIVLSAGAAATLAFAGCSGDPFHDDFVSLWSYTCSDAALDDAQAVSDRLSQLQMRAMVYDDCNSGPASIDFKAVTSVDHTVALLRQAFRCRKRGSSPEAHAVTLECTSQDARFIATLGWTERRDSAGQPRFRGNGRAVLVRGQDDIDVVLSPVPE